MTEDKMHLINKFFKMKPYEQYGIKKKKNTT